MSRDFKIMSRHKTKLKSEKLCHNKEILCHDIFSRATKIVMLLQQSFYVVTQDPHVTIITRQLQQNSVVTFSNSIVTEFKKKARNYVTTENCKPRQKLENKDDNYVTT